MKKEYRVWWIDSEGSTDWELIEDVIRHNSEQKLCYSVGILIAEDERNITLAQSLDEGNDRVNNTIKIPIIAIIKKRRIP